MAKAQHVSCEGILHNKHGHRPRRSGPLRQSLSMTLLFTVAVSLQLARQHLEVEAAVGSLLAAIEAQPVSR